MSVLRRKLTARVIIHADHGSQLTSQEWRGFQTNQNLKASMSQRDTCYDKAVAESIFHLLKTGRVRRKTYRTAKTPVTTCSISSIYTTIDSVGTLIIGRCHTSNLR